MTAIETSSKNLRETWTAERVAQLKGGVNAGLSCAQIANEIGVSRNAVIGKINQLGLSRGRNPATPRPRSGVLIRRPQVLTNGWCLERFSHLHLLPKMSSARILARYLT